MEPRGGTDEEAEEEAALERLDDDGKEPVAGPGGSGVPSPPKITRPVHRFYPNPSDS